MEIIFNTTFLVLVSSKFLTSEIEYVFVYSLFSDLINMSADLWKIS